MIIDNIIQDYKSDISIVFFKDSPQIVITKIPECYINNPEIELGPDNIYHPILHDKSKESIRDIDFFFSEISSKLSLSKIDKLIKINDTNTRIALYKILQKDIFELKNIVDENDEPVLSFLDILKLSNPTTFAEKQHQTVCLLLHIFNMLKDHTGSTCFKFKKIYDTLVSFIKDLSLYYTKEEISAYLSFYNNIFYSFKDIITDDTYLALQTDYKQENRIYELLKQYEDRNSPFFLYQSSYYEDFSEEQNNACQHLIPSKGLISILNGGPGTGKTTILQKIVSNMKESYPQEKIALLAPTGKAAKRISEVMNFEDIYIGTIHKFLGYRIDGSFVDTAERNERLENTHLIIIDESSMLNISLLYTLLENINKQKTKILLVGDIDQLPSIEPGYVLRDLQTLNTPVYTLTKNYRSVGPIIENAIKMREGKTDLIYDSEHFILSENDIYDSLSEIIEDTSFSTMILSPYKRKIQLSTDVINKTAHEMHSSYAGFTKFTLGDKVLITKTKYVHNVAQYVNGDIGIVQSIFQNKDSSYQYYILLQDDSTVTVPETDLDYAYALTIHKSQGSECPVVHLIIPFYSEFITKKMFYTAVTRAKEKIIIHSTKEIIQKILLNDKDYERNTILQLKS